MALDQSGLGAVDLSLLVSSKLMSDRERDAGLRILRRMSAPVRVAVHGPDPHATNAVFSYVQANTTPDICAVEFELGGEFVDADIILWCTHTFASGESEIWAYAPNTLKDHSFLIACAPPPDKLPHLRGVVDENFIAFHHLSALGADAELKKMSDDLVRQIQSGAQAVRDSAHLFVQRHHAKMPTPPQPFDVGEPQALQKPITRETVLLVSEPVLDIAMARFSDHAAALMELADADLGDIGKRVLQLCCTASEDLIEVFTTGSSDHPGYTALSDVMHEASDKIMLMSLEKDLSAATDAVAILLQVHKDISVCMAT